MTTTLRVELEPVAAAAIRHMSGERRQARFIEAIIPAIDLEFQKVLEGKADPFDPLTQALLPFVEAYRQRQAAEKATE